MQSLPTSPSSTRRQAWIWTWLAIFTILTCRVEAQLDNKTSPTHQFKSRPDLHAPIVHFHTLRPDLVTPGYIFLGPYRNVDPGPYIYDNDGELVWSGAGQSGPRTAHTPRVCKYHGEDHLCYFTGQQHQGFARGHGVIMDKHYRTVRTIEAQGAGASSDMHEFRMTPYTNGSTVLMTVYQPRPYDLTTNPRFNLEHGMGWIVEGVFQEIEIDTGKLIFEWRSLDHVDPSEGWTLPGATDTSGTGLHEEHPWDYFHLNSVDKNADGDYLISARHTSAIYKVSGKDGSILWQLGGNSPSFDQVNFQFSYQHHARWMSENNTHTVFSFYDNAGNGYNTTGNFSHGWIIEIDHDVGTATMIKEWGAPELKGGMLSTSQGNMQLLENGGCHIGWGEHAYFSEHTADGTTVMYAQIAKRASNVMIYRSNKYNWTADPLTSPALWTYSLSEEEDTTFWVSWNGATEVRSWNFYVGSTASGPWEYAGNSWKSGFETEYSIEGFAPWSYAEALDTDGTPLGTSVISKTFVPSERLRPNCDNRGCDYAEAVPVKEQVPYEAVFQLGELSTNRGYNTSHYYEHMSDTGYDKIEPRDHDVDFVHVLLVFAAATVGLCLWKRGCVQNIMDAMLRSSLSRPGPGRYNQVRQKVDMDDFDAGSGHSTPELLA